jgi:hypothetical protein
MVQLFNLTEPRNSYGTFRWVITNYSRSILPIDYVAIGEIRLYSPDGSVRP